LIVRHTKPRPTAEKVWRYALLFACPTVVLWALRGNGSSSEVLVQTLVGEVLLSAVLLFPATYAGLTKVQQGAIVFLIAICVIGAAAGSGSGEWNAPNGQGTVQLLIAPEVATGVERLGVVFPHDVSAGPARLSEQVTILYTGARTYTFRLNNSKIVQISKDKVWAMSPRESPTSARKR
jgi:hypothetical protein